MVAASPYFRALLMSDSKEREIPLIGIDGPTLTAIIDHCYSCVIELNEDNVGQIITAASSMKLIELEQRCVEFLREKIDVDSCVDIMLSAVRSNLKDLLEESMVYICKNFSLVPIEDIVRIDEKNFGALLRADTIAADEDKIFDTFVKWAQHDEAARSKHIASLANCIRLKHASVEVGISNFVLMSA